MRVNRANILKAIDHLNIESRAVCIHSSLKSFGFVEGGAKTIIDAFLDRGYTILVPTFSYDYCIYPPKNDRPLRNGCDYANFYGATPNNDKIFTIYSNNITIESMGAIPYEVLKMHDRERGYNPINSFTSIGPMAKDLVVNQSATDVYAPLKKLYDICGYVILMGLDLTRMTAIHYAEERSGRNCFVRWANGLNGEPIRVSTGSCSRGFNNFEPILNKVEKRILVGKSLWRIFPMRETIDLAVNAIKENQMITYCGDPQCERCRDAVQGGPII